jgi:RIO kinase 1
VPKHIFDPDKYEYYEELLDPLRTDRKARRKRKPKVNHTPKKTQSQILVEIAEATGLEEGFKTTYQPGRYEEEWLLSSLQAFYYEDLINDVLAIVKGGKEANVYRCEAHPAMKATFLAAKVYRPRKFRNLRNDKMYREGRTILTTEGRPIQERDHRMKQALMKGTNFGAQLKHTSWLMYEYTTLERLYRAGGAVPQPIAASDNAILMSYVGNERIAAPTLNQVDLSPAEAKPLFQEVLRNIELMLQNNLIHGDLSAYNILYWAGKITLIDFPQVVNSRTNSNAYSILQRDITRTSEYFAAQGVSSDPNVITAELWARYVEMPSQKQELPSYDYSPPET